MKFPMTANLKALTLEEMAKKRSPIVTELRKAHPTATVIELQDLVAQKLAFDNAVNGERERHPAPSYLLMTAYAGEYGPRRALVELTPELRVKLIFYKVALETAMTFGTEIRCIDVHETSAYFGDGTEADEDLDDYELVEGTPRLHFAYRDSDRGAPKSEADFVVSYRTENDRVVLSPEGFMWVGVLRNSEGTVESYEVPWAALGSLT